MTSRTSSFSEKISVALLFAVAVGWRLAVAFSGKTEWLNFAPLAAIALCGAICLPRRTALALPLAALLASDLVLNAHYGAPLVSPEMAMRYIALALAGGIGLLLRPRPALPRVLGGSLAASVLFYFLTNAASWIGNPFYPQTPGGLAQALWSGRPGFPPTWMFFRNTLCSDVVFTALFLGCMAAARGRSGAEERFPAQLASAPPR